MLEKTSLQEKWQTDTKGVATCTHPKFEKMTVCYCATCGEYFSKKTADNITNDRRKLDNAISTFLAKLKAYLIIGGLSPNIDYTSTIQITNVETDCEKNGVVICLGTQGVDGQPLGKQLAQAIPAIQDDHYLYLFSLKEVLTLCHENGIEVGITFKNSQLPDRSNL